MKALARERNESGRPGPAIENRAHARPAEMPRYSAPVILLNDVVENKRSAVRFLSGWTEISKSASQISSEFWYAHHPLNDPIPLIFDPRFAATGRRYARPNHCDSQCPPAMTRWGSE